MKTKTARERRSDCPISVTLEALGDSWSLLIVRDLMFFGRKTYNEFLNTGEKIATNILADRLQRLEASGIIVKQRDSNDARRYIYRLTEKGIDLAPMLVEVVLWAVRHESADTPSGVIELIQADKDRFITRVREIWAAANTLEKV